MRSSDRPQWPLELNERKDQKVIIPSLSNGEKNQTKDSNQFCARRYWRGSGNLETTFIPGPSVMMQFRFTVDPPRKIEMGDDPYGDPGLGHGKIFETRPQSPPPLLSTLSLDPKAINPDGMRCWQKLFDRVVSFGFWVLVAFVWIYYIYYRIFIGTLLGCGSWSCLCFGKREPIDFVCSRGSWDLVDVLFFWMKCKLTGRLMNPTGCKICLAVFRSVTLKIFI